MNRFYAFFLIVLIAIFLGGIFGIIHDQLTYTISNEYYTKFKFIQFGVLQWCSGVNVGNLMHPEIDIDQPRIGVSIVGFLATWWIGLFIGVFLAIAGFVHRNGKEMLIATLRAFGLTMGIAFLTGIIGLFYGKWVLVPNPPNWFLPEHLEDKEAFIMVGSMHNFSYLGGLIGLILGIFYCIWQKRSFIKKENNA